MDKVIVIRHSDEELPNTKYTANLKKNEDGSYTASLDIYKQSDYKDYVNKKNIEKVGQYVFTGNETWIYDSNGKRWIGHIPVSSNPSK